MKLFFSLLFISTHSLASMIIIQHENREFEALRVKEYFMHEYQIPKSLIRVQQRSCNKSIDNRFLHLCVNKKGELLQLSSNIDFQIKSLSTFNRPN